MIRGTVPPFRNLGSLSERLNNYSYHRQQQRERMMNSTTEWTLIKSTRETPCCHQGVRVKVVQPGPQSRKCSLCKRTNWFMLEPSSMFPDRLRMRWMTDEEIAEVEK